MFAVFVLILGVMLILVITLIALYNLGLTHILPTLVPLAPALVMVGTALLIITELLLFLGNKEDRRTAFNDLLYMIPTLLISGGLWYLAKYYLW
ncbi:MAG: hypothetical protein SNJ70_08355 [Armatimonadota bacterium]